MSGRRAQPRSLVVRIYRQGYNTLSGVAEDAATGVQKPFSNLEELWKVLSTVCRSPRRRSKLPKTISE